MAIKQYKPTNQWLVICDETNRIIQVHDNKQEALKNDFQFDIGSVVNVHGFRYDYVKEKSVRTSEIYRVGVVVSKSRYGVNKDGSPLYNIKDQETGNIDFCGQEFLTYANVGEQD